MEKEFAYVTKENPKFVDSIDPVAEFAETASSFLIKTYYYQYAIKKDDLLAWEYRDLIRDEDGRCPPPKGFQE